MALIDPADARQGRAAAAATNRHLYTDADPLDLVPFADKVNLCQTIDAAARARDPRVAQVSVGLSGTWSVVEIVRADGFVATDVRPLVRLNVSIVVEAEWPARDGQLRHRRPLSLRPAVRARDVEPRDRRGAGAGAGQSRRRSTRPRAR